MFIGVTIRFTKHRRLYVVKQVSLEHLLARKGFEEEVEKPFYLLEYNKRMMELYYMVGMMGHIHVLIFEKHFGNQNF